MDKTLLRRILTAALLVPLVLGVVLFAPTSVLGVVLGAIVVGAGWEWGRLMGWPAPARIGYALALAPLLYGCHRLVSIAPSAPVIVLASGVAWWALAAVWVARYQGGMPVRAGGAWIVRLALGWLVLVPPWVAMTSLHGRGEQGPSALLVLLLLIWTADIGAFFAGRRWGKRKLASRVSPGKSWEGVAGAVAGGALVGLAAGFLYHLPAGALLGFVLLCVATVPVSVVGDLTESLFKRLAGVKDSGSLLPGHGGILDRIDSLTAAAPFFVLGWIALRALP